MIEYSREQVGTRNNKAGRLDTANDMSEIETREQGDCRHCWGQDLTRKQQAGWLGIVEDRSELETGGQGIVGTVEDSV